MEPRDIPGAEDAFLGFETLTLVPIDRTLVDPALLSRDEIAWWNAYHARVLDVVGPLVDGDARIWLDEQCRPL